MTMVSTACSDNIGTEYSSWNASAVGSSETESVDFKQTGSIDFGDGGDDIDHEYDVTVGGGIDWNRAFAASVVITGVVLGILVGWWVTAEMKRADCGIDVLLGSQAARLVETLAPENVTMTMIGGTAEEFRSMMMGAVSARGGVGLEGVYYVNLFPRGFNAAPGTHRLETFCADASQRKESIRQRVYSKYTGLPVNSMTIIDTSVDAVICNALQFGVKEREVALERGLTVGVLRTAPLVVGINKVLAIETLLKLSSSAMYRMVLFGRATVRGVRELVAAGCDNGFVPVGVLKTSGRGCETLVAGVQEYMVTLGRQNDAREAARTCQQWKLLL